MCCLTNDEDEKERKERMTKDFTFTNLYSFTSALSGLCGLLEDTSALVVRALLEQERCPVW